MKVMLAIDGSRYSTMSANMLRAFELPTSTEIIMVTVVPEFAFVGGITVEALVGGAAERERLQKVQEDNARALLDTFVGTFGARGHKVSTLVCNGGPSDQILKKAHETGADMIVVGAKGQSDSRRFPLGTVSQKILKYARSSVLLVRESPPALRNVLIATDGSRYSSGMARFLLDLPLPVRTRVTALTSLESHVAALLRTPTFDFASNKKVLAQLQDAEEAAARKIVNETLARFRSKGYSVSPRVLKGEPAEVILSAAQEMRPDLIALGAKGLAGVEAFLLGSVAQRVARFAKCSVLIGRASRHG